MDRKNRDEKEDNRQEDREVEELLLDTTARAEATTGTTPARGPHARALRLQEENDREQDPDEDLGDVHEIPKFQVRPLSARRRQCAISRVQLTAS